MGRLLVVTLAAGALLVAVGAAVASRSDAPQLRFDESVAADFRVLAEETWQRFTTAFSDRLDCFGDVDLVATYELDDRARYDPATATIVVRVPATYAVLAPALVHELAHHVEFQCPEHEALRPPFLEAQGLDATTPWLGGVEWEEIPSELYAETAVELVLGKRRPTTRYSVTPAATRVVADWLVAKT